MKIKATTADAYNLLRDGAVALAQVERNGLKVDLDYLDKATRKVDRRIAVLEEELKEDKVYKTWENKFATVKLDSPDQLGEVIFGVMGHECPERTAKTRRYKTNEKAFQNVDLPFIPKFFERRKLKKAKSTYLLNLKRQTIDGYFHPNFNLHIASTFRSSSGADKEEDRGGKDFNFQNIPTRNKMIAEIIRQSFVAPDGFVVGEMDYGQIEVRIGCPYHKDRNMIRYCSDPSTDMHGDMAEQIFFLERKEISKNTRTSVKAKFVFAEFFGDFYVRAAKSLWESIELDKLVIEGTDVSLKKRLRQHGIKELGACDPSKKPKPGTFEHHLKKIEDDFWNNRFPGYTAWKKRWWRQYLETGGFTTLTGFRVEGVFDRNYVINNPIQGSAFHCTLWSIIQLQRWLNKNKMLSRIVGQIHDSIVLYIHVSEIQEVLTAARRIMTEDLPRCWNWINVPLLVEPEIAPEGASWFHKQKWHHNGTKWAPEKKRAA